MKICLCIYEQDNLLSNSILFVANPPFFNLYMCTTAVSPVEIKSLFAREFSSGYKYIYIHCLDIQNILWCCQYRCGGVCKFTWYYFIREFSFWNLYSRIAWYADQSNYLLRKYIYTFVLIDCLIDWLIDRRV